MKTEVPLDEVLVRRFVDDLREVAFLDWKFHVGLDDVRPFLQVRFTAADTRYGGAPEHQTGRKWFLSPHMTKSEVVQTALKAVLTAVEHEARENFKYRGAAIFGPHINVEALWLASKAPADKRVEEGSSK